MNEQDLDKTLNQDEFEEVEPTILRNEIGKVVDPTVVVEEANRTVVLTNDETIIIEKEHLIDIPPKNRPRKVYGGMWGPVEIATVGGAMVAIFAAILVYIFVVAPSNREVENNRVRLAALENELVSARSKYGNITSTKSQVEVVLSSVSDFESRLPAATNGRTALYQKINGLIAGYGLVNTTGPDYSPLEIADQENGNQSEEERGKSKFKSLFPGVYVTTTVEGPYVNLRRFLQEIETGNEFIIVSAVDLEPSDSEQKSDPGTGATQASVPGGVNPTLGGFSESNTRMPMQPTTSQAVLPNSQRGKTHGSTVRLRLEMAAYFRRPNLIAPVEPQVVSR